MIRYQEFGSGGTRRFRDEDDDDVDDFGSFYDMLARVMTAEPWLTRKEAEDWVRLLFLEEEKRQQKKRQKAGL